MSISAALSTALSGLSVNSRRSQAVAANVANAMTPSYGRRVVHLSSATLGGVKVSGVTRNVDAATLSQRLLADAEAGASSYKSDALEEIGRLVGTPGEAGSLTDRLANFESTLLAAASRPDSTVRLEAAARAGAALAGTLNDAADGVQDVRLRADAQIARDVDALNSGLARIAKLNARIVADHNKPGGTNAWKDQRQEAMDQIAAIIPIRTFPRDGGAVSMMSEGGTVLLDGRPGVFEFSPATAMAPEFSVAGSLSGIKLNGEAVATGKGSRLSGGRLSAAFAVRDDHGPAAQQRLDAFSRDLVERLSGFGFDPTLNPGDASLFTDDGSAFSPANEQGLAGRIALNPLADPDASGEAWRLRDGLQAASAGPVGDPAGLSRIIDALEARRAPASGPFAGVPRTSSSVAAEVTSLISAAAAEAGKAAAFTRSAADTLREREVAGGVDTDKEMQKLLLIEQSYSANARVMQAADAMIRRLMEI